MNLKILVGALVLFSSNAMSGGSITSTVDFVQVNVETGANSNYGVVKFTTQPSGSPACATDPDGRMIFSLDSEGGKVFYSTVLAAKVAKSTVDVYGTGNCHSGLELVSFARIK